MSPMRSLAGGSHLLASFWILDPIYSAMGTVLAWFYALIPSYGLAIALLTVAVRILLVPLTTKQVKSQQAMQRIQPELKRLQAKYKDDRTKLNEEMMKFYKENKVNPVAGCLPLLLQTPLFLVLYRLILGLTHRPEPQHLPRSSELYRSLLDSGGKMVSWGIDLAQSASSQHGLGNAWPYYILVLITVATGFYQQRQMTARMPAGSTNAQMKMIGRVFPAFIGLISLSIPAGVVVYFIISNIWQIAQQDITFRTLGPATGTGPVAKTDKDKDKDKDKADRADKADRDGAKPGRDGQAKGASGGKGANANKASKGAAPARTGLFGRAAAASKAATGRKPAGSKPGGGKGQAGKPGTGKAQSGKPPAKPSARPTGRQQPKSKRPPPSPRPKGLPGTGSTGSTNGQDDPSTRNTPRGKDR